MRYSASKKSVFPAVVFVLLALVAANAAAPQIPKEPIKWSMEANLPEKPLRPGDAFTVQLSAKIDDGWHLYSLDQAEGGPTPTRIAMPKEQNFEQAGGVESPEPQMAMDPNFNLMTHYYEEQVVFVIPVKVSANAPEGKAEVKVNVSFQTCNDELCLPPKTVKLAAAVSIAR